MFLKKRMNLSIHNVRQAFILIGYKASFKNHPLIENCKTLTVKDPDGNFVVGGNNCVYSVEEHKKHREAFNLYGRVLDEITRDGVKIK